MELEEIVNKKFEGNKRLKHIYGVANMSKMLAKKYGVDEKKAYIAGLLHDFCKYETYEYMESLMTKDEINMLHTAKEVYHAYASSEYARRFLNITDPDILNAIKYHVYGRLNMSMLEKIVVISDFCEPTRDFPEAEIVRNHLDNIDQALYETLNYSVEFLYKKNKMPLEDELEVLNYYKEKYYGITKKDC